MYPELEPIRECSRDLTLSAIESGSAGRAYRDAALRPFPFDNLPRTIVTGVFQGADDGH